MFPLPVFPALLWTFLPEPPSSLAHHWTHKVVLNVLPLCKSVKVSTDDWGLLFRPIIGWYSEGNILPAPQLGSPCFLGKRDKYSCRAPPADNHHNSDQNIFINSSLTESPPCAAPTTKYTWSTTPGENTWWCCDWCAGNNLPFLVGPFEIGSRPAQRVRQHLEPAASPFLSDVRLRMISMEATISKTCLDGKG